MKRDLAAAAGALTLLLGTAQADATAYIVTAVNVRQSTAPAYTYDENEYLIDEQPISAEHTETVSHDYGATGVNTTTARASADLTTGVLRASASGGCNGQGPTCAVSGTATAYAILYDTLSFSGDGLVQVHFEVTSTRDVLHPGNPREGDDAQLNAWLDLDSSHFGLRSWPFYSSDDLTHETYGMVTGPWIDPMVNYDGHTAIFTSSIQASALRNVNLTVGLNAVATNGSSVDIWSGAKLWFEMVDGVSYMSGSGVFGTAQAVAGVPEPASWAMMLAGFGVVGAAMRSRRRTATRFG